MVFEIPIPYTPPTNFEDGKIQGFYERDPATGNYNLKTMYPEPKR